MCHCNTSIVGGRAVGTDRACWLPDELESENSFRKRPFLKGIMQSAIDEHAMFFGLHAWAQVHVPPPATCTYTTPIYYIHTFWGAGEVGKSGTTIPSPVLSTRR